MKEISRAIIRSIEKRGIPISSGPIQSGPILAQGLSGIISRISANKNTLDRLKLSRESFHIIGAPSNIVKVRKRCGVKDRSFALHLSFQKLECELEIIDLQVEGPVQIIFDTGVSLRTRKAMDVEM